MHVEESGIPRKTFLVTGLALSAAALAACTTYGKKPAASSAPVPTASGGTPAPGTSANAVAKTSEVPVGSGVIVGDVVITQPSSGEFRGFSTTCTHAGCAVNEIQNGKIDC